jgi:hypothetical protein
MKKQLSQLKPTVDLIEKADLKSLKAGFPQDYKDPPDPLDPGGGAPIPSTSHANQGDASQGGSAGYDSCVCACYCI